jgi:hypothetical protein
LHQTTLYKTSNDYLSLCLKLIICFSQNSLVK